MRLKKIYIRCLFDIATREWRYNIRYANYASLLFSGGSAATAARGYLRSRSGVEGRGTPGRRDAGPLAG